MLQIGDIVQQSNRGADVGDVQIGWYPSSPYNAQLAKNYMFTATAESEKHSSLEILKRIRDTFLFPGENRLTVIATYGHGKTHLALALANFFGKPAETQEVQDLLGAIKSANSNVYEQYRSFKEENAPFLVVRLQGNASESLHRLFLNAVSQALKEVEPLVGPVHLPFWFSEAITFLERLTSERLAEANAFLNSRSQDVAGLLAALRQHNETVYETCRELSKHLNGVYADFGSEVSLDEVIKWLTQNYCGRDKPLRGLLVLFDEFAVFVERYAERRVGSNSGALQQLLDGILNAGSSACFVAFSQMDPDDVAKRYFARDGVHTGNESDITKELTRLKKDYRFLLHSSLERVLDAYLEQDENLWNQIAPTVDEALSEATDLTVQLLPSRYDYKMKWGPEEVYDRLTYGCFPLHPLTTGLLCTLQLQQGTVTRSVLGAVRHALETVKEQPAILDKRPNWLYPVRLVDWFEDMLGEQNTYDAYKRALQSVGGDATAAEIDLLKAILLQLTANLAPTSHGAGGYARLVSVLSGHTAETCATVLQQLTDRYLLEKDPVKDLYRFPQGGDGEQARKLQKAVEAQAKNTPLNTLSANVHLVESHRLVKQPMGHLAAAHEVDYGAQEWILQRQDFTTTFLKTHVCKSFQLDSKGSLQNGDRGAIVYLLAANDDDVAYFASEAERILNETFPADQGYCIPIVVGLPTTPRPQLLRRIRTERTLKRPDLLAEWRQYGTGAGMKVNATVKVEVDADLKALCADVKWVVPAIYMAQVNQVAAKNDWRIKLECCYRLAYSALPPAFKKQYAANTTNLKKGVQLVAESLATGKLSKELDPIRRASPIARDVIEYLLSNGQPTSWTLLDMSGSPQVPTKQGMEKAWRHLDACLVPGKSMSIRDALLPLMNPPFGYDWNHLTLLFCAWLGYYGNRLLWEQNGVAKTVHDYTPALVKPDTFITNLCTQSVTLRQIDEASESKRIRELIETIRTGTAKLTPAQAKKHRSELSAFSQNSVMEEEARNLAGDFAKRLSDALSLAEEYQQEATAIQRILTTTAKVPELFSHLARIESGTLPKPSLVSPEGVYDLATLREQVRSHITKLIERDLTKFSAPKSLELFGEYQYGLEQAKNHANRLREEPLKLRIETALSELGQRQKSLEEEQHDKNIIIELQKIHPSASAIIALEDQEQSLAAIEARGEKARELLAKKRTDIRKALQDAQEFLEKMPERIEGITIPSQVTEIQRVLDRKEFLFQGSSNEAEFRKLDERVTQLQTAFDILGRVAVKNLDNPREINDRESELEKSYQALRSTLTPGLQTAFENAITAVRERRDSLVLRAEQWLERHENKPPRDTSTLDEPPPFLSPDGKTRLKALKERLRDQIVKQTEQGLAKEIEQHFSQLSTDKKREFLDLLKRQLAKLDESLR